MDKILIDPHYCSQDEYQTLIDYLKRNTWDFHFIENKEKTPIRIGDIPPNVYQLIIKALKEERKIFAIIKAKEGIKGLELKEAKALIEEISFIEEIITIGGYQTPPITNKAE